MTDASLIALRRLLLSRYEEFKSRLARHLGSSELAGEALQDTWLRLERGDGIAAVQSHASYLFRIAVNQARDRQRAEDRLLRADEVETLLGTADEAPDAERIVVARAELRALEAAMAELPPRQRAILLAARLDGLSRRELAARYRISVRLVQRELQEAQDYCAARLRRRKLYASNPRETSSNRNPVSEEYAGDVEPDGDA